MIFKKPSEVFMFLVLWLREHRCVGEGSDDERDKLMEAIEALEALAEGMQKHGR
jgi:hypothetical protein